MQNSRYDTVVIGSGIAGLTAACYLAKAGHKVLLLEKETEVGGYCGSFTKNGFIFDKASHYLNHLSQKGMLQKICNELEVHNKIKFADIDLIDHVIVHDTHINIYRNIDKTISELQDIFPEDRSSIVNFINMIINFNFVELQSKYKTTTFQVILDQFFNNQTLKTALSILASTLGLPPNKLSGLAALGYFKGSVLDGGYLPIGGSQSFSNALLDQFLHYGGHARVSCCVKNIIIRDGRVMAVCLDSNEIIETDFIVANCDATSLYRNMLNEKDIHRNMVYAISKLKPSISTLIVYLGISQSLMNTIPHSCNTWYFPYDNYNDGDTDISFDQRDRGFVHVSVPSLHDKSLAPIDSESMMLISNASFLSSQYWESNKQRLADVLIERAAHVIPRLKELIKFRIIATPHTLNRYTSNRAGAYRGWELSPEQTKWKIVTQRSPIDGLFLAGHWVTTPVGNGGISMVANSGRAAAKMVIHSIDRCGLNI